MKHITKNHKSHPDHSRGRGSTTTKSSRQTQKLGYGFAKEIISSTTLKLERKKAVVILLYGDLGGGKTTFLQGFAKGLAIRQKVLSPTFVIMKKFPLSYKGNNRVICAINNFYHFDCYRINESKEILELNFREIINNPQNIIAIEWPEKIKKYLPKNYIKIKFEFIDNNTRNINILKQNI